MVTAQKTAMVDAAQFIKIMLIADAVKEHLFLGIHIRMVDLKSHDAHFDILFGLFFEKVTRFLGRMGNNGNAAGIADDLNDLLRRLQIIPVSPLDF